MKEIYKLRTLKQSLHSKQRQNSQQNTIKSQKSRYTDRPWAFSISNRKKEELQKQRQMEIDMEQKALNFRMTEIKSKRKHSQYIDSQNNYLKHPLHENVRKQKSRLIRQENLAHRKRLQNSRGTINLKKLQNDWKEKQTIRQFVSKHQRLNKKDSISQSVQSDQDWLHQSPEKIVKYQKEREINGTKILLTIEEYSHVVMISGLLTIENQRVVMVVDRRKIDAIIKDKCKGKLSYFLNLLDFDPTITSLSYLTSDPENQDEFISDICSQFDLNRLKKSLMKQHILLSTYKHKENLDEKQETTKKGQQNGTPQTYSESTKKS